MNIFNKVTVQSLKKNKTRTVVTIIGIILSAAMICAVTTFASSIRDYALRDAIYREGAWHGRTLYTDPSQYEKIKQSPQVASAVFLQKLGYARAEGCTNVDKPYLYVVGTSVGTEDMLSVHLTAGRYPETNQELLLPEHLATNGGVHYAIGDTVELGLGMRMSDGFYLEQNNPITYVEKDGEAIPQETLEVRETRTYTVVGFYKRLSYGIETFTAPGYTAITAADEAPGDTYRYDVYFKMHKPQDVYSFMEENEYEDGTNHRVLMFQGVSRYDSFSEMLVSLSAIVIVLIMFGSVSLIYNAFSISVSERTKQFGLLSSIGATKKQLRKSVLFEAFAVSVIGIPIGVLSGIGGIGVTLMLIGDKFQSLGMQTEMRLAVSPLSVAAAVVIALLTVLISAWIPSRRAMRVTAMEAIRLSGDIKAQNKPIKTSRLTYKLFGLPGMLAGKYYKRNRKKYRATVMSLFMSIVLFVSASAFTGYLMDSVTGGFGSNGYDLSLSFAEDRMKGKTPEEIEQLIREEEAVTQVVYLQREILEGVSPKTYLRQEALEMGAMAGASGLHKEALGIDEEKLHDVTGFIYFVKDSEFRRLLQQYHLEEAKFMDPQNPLAITVDGSAIFDQGKGKFVDTKLLQGDALEITGYAVRQYEGYEYIGSDINVKTGEVICRFRNEQDKKDIMEVPYQEANVPYTLKSGKTVHEYPFYVNQGYGACLHMIYPMRMRSAVLPEQEGQVAYYEYYMTSREHGKTYENLEKTMKEMGLSPDNFHDYAESVEDSRNMVTIIRVFSYGFIVLISLIAVANVFNTISTNISLRRREFAMLKSVGMTAKGFQKMMNYECLLYGSRALLFGLPASLWVTYLIWRSTANGFETAFRLPWGALGIAVLSVFAVVFATMMYAMGKIKKENPIDALKNENL